MQDNYLQFKKGDVLVVDYNPDAPEQNGDLITVIKVVRDTGKIVLYADHPKHGEVCYRKSILRPITPLEKALI